MNPDLEQRLRSGLNQEAGALPDHGGSPQTAIATGRRHRTTRRIGTGLAAAALFVGGGTLWTQNQPNDPVEVVVADDGQRGLTDTTELGGDASDTTADSDDGPQLAMSDTSFALALGEQVVVVDGDGYHEIVWQASPSERLVTAQSAGDTGVVIETFEQVLWLAAGADRATVLKTEDQNLFLHDVARVNGSWAAIWSEAPIDWESEEFKGSSRLVAQDVETGVEFEIESYSWIGEGDDWKYYADATPLFENGPMAIVRSYNQGACHWIDPIAPGGVMSAIATPLPRPADPANGCTNPIITDVIAEANGANGPRLAYVTGDFGNEDVVVNTTDDGGSQVTFPVEELHSLLRFRDGRVHWAEIVAADDGRAVVVIEADVNLGSTREVWRIGLGGSGVDEREGAPVTAPAEPNDLPDDLAATTPELASPAPPIALDWKSYLRTVPELTLDPSLEASGDRFPRVSDYYDVFDGRGGGYPVFDAVLYADLDGDGAEEAVIPLDSGGTSLGTGALIFRSSENGPQLVGPESFYERVGQKVWPTVEDGHLVMRGAIGADWEPTCCLSGEFASIWTVTEGRLEMISSSETGVPGARSPAVERFYQRIDNGDFDEAYAMLSPAQQAREPFEPWKAGFETTREIGVDAVSISGTDRVSFELVAADEAADGTVSRSVYEGTWSLIYSSEHHQWLLDSFDVRLVRSEELPEPKPDPEAIDETLVAANPTDFVSPSGNITCSMAAGSVWCHIGDKDWEISAPAGCLDDYGNIVELSTDGAEFGCYTDLFWDIEAETLAFGSTATSGDFSCTMQTNGVRCVDEDGDGFLIGRNAIELLGDQASGNGGAASNVAGLDGAQAVGFGTWGPLEVGMSKNELGALGIGLVFEDDYISEGCAFAYFPGSTVLPVLMLVDDVLARIEFVDASQSGPKGLNHASSEAEILAAYPNAMVTPHPYGFGANDNSHYVEIADPSGADRSFIFETNGTDVTAFRTGDTFINRWIEGCA